MSSELLTVALSIACAVLSASFFVAQCVAQEEARTARLRARQTKPRRSGSE